ncbi:recombinase family protein [Streptomyces sp. 891-h]|nr:recombinase family protein [Streptomyces sp. 891-h]
MTQAWPATFDGPEAREPFIGYIRVSTWKEEKISPELQETALRQWAARTGRRLLEPLTYDLDATGRNFNRKIMRDIERVEAGEARGIAVWRYSRFGRNRNGNHTNLARLESVGGRLESATEPVDASTAVGRFQRGMIMEFSAYESDRAGEQWIETMDHRRTLGVPSTGRPRFGYIWHPRRVPNAKGGWTVQEERYEIDSDLGPVAADLYLRYVDGCPFYALTAWLNGHGYVTTRGNLWTEQSLIHYLDSGFGAGLLRVHDRRCGCKRGRNGRCPNHLFIQGAHEELIEYSVWEEYQKRRREVRSTPPRSRNPQHPLSNLARCGNGCRGTATLSSAERKGEDGNTHTVRGYAYQCGRRGATGTHGCAGVWAKREDVEEQVLAWVEREVAPGVDNAPSTPQQRLALEKRQRAAADYAHLQAEVDKYATALARLRAEHAIDPAEWGEGEYEAARDRIQQKKRAAERALDRVAAVTVLPDPAEFRPVLVGLVEEWATLNTEEKNALLKQVIRRVALVRRPSGGVEAVVHPVWEPDPWDDTRAEASAA